MFTQSDFIGIRGWVAKVKFLVPTYKDNKLSSVVGQISFFPHREDRNINLGGKKLSLDVLFQCFSEEVAKTFYKTVKPGDILIITGDLNERSWSEYKPELTTNCWIDEFVIDKSKGQCSPIVGQLETSNLDEFFTIANTKYNKNCPHCDKKMIYVPYETAKYCIKCNT